MSNMSKIRVKLLGKYQPGTDGVGWSRFFPHGGAIWQNCEFIFDRNCRDYDWLVVNDDLPSVSGERFTLWEEKLACSSENTLLITNEPSTIKVYGADYMRQFRWVLSSQEPWVINHNGMIYRQPGLVWFYSHNEPKGCYDHLKSNPPTYKKQEISAVCSNKQQKHTLHRQRYEFIMSLKEAIPEMELYGRGIRFVEEKADAMDDFKYHVAIENFYGPHHWTEKLADCFLAACMPVYYGCPNSLEYFPDGSILNIDLADPIKSAEIIKAAIKDDLYTQNISSIMEGRRLVLDKYNPVAQLAEIICDRHSASHTGGRGGSILSRHLMRRSSWISALKYGLEKTYVKSRHKFNSIS